jgi:hypothetical protein
MRGSWVGFDKFYAAAYREDLERDNRGDFVGFETLMQEVSEVSYDV